MGAKEVIQLAHSNGEDKIDLTKGTQGKRKI